MNEEGLWRYISESCNPERKAGLSGTAKQKDRAAREVGFQRGVLRERRE